MKSKVQTAQQEAVGQRMLAIVFFSNQNTTINIDLLETLLSF